MDNALNFTMISSVMQAKVPGRAGNHEITRRVAESDGEEDHLVGGREDHRGDGPDDVFLAPDR